MTARLRDALLAAALGPGVRGHARGARPPAGTLAMLVRFRGATDEQVRWGGNDDPRGVLRRGQDYEVERVEVHTQHTKYWIGGRAYNSVHFVVVEETATRGKPQ